VRIHGPLSEHHKNEFGIRLALGATRRQIQMLIVGQTARILLVGILPGAILSIFAVRAASHFLYGSSARICSQSSRQASCSHLPVLSPRSSPLAARRLPTRWKRFAVNNRHPSQCGLGRTMGNNVPDLL
jgi:ABC-type antimicrobial peptide transport system permease subunit